MKSAPAIEKPRTLIGWRLLALLYDVWPVLAMWLAVAIPFVLVDVVISGDVRHNIEPFSPMWWLLWACCWAERPGCRSSRRKSWLKRRICGQFGKRR